MAISGLTLNDFSKYACAWCIAVSIINIREMMPHVKEIESILLDDDRRCLDDFYAQALSVLKRQGFDDACIYLKIVANKLTTGKAVLDEARKGGYGTLNSGDSQLIIMDEKQC